MKTIRQIAEAALITLTGFLLFLLFFEHRVELPAWLRVAGRMHPMVLHFPIVLLIISLFSWWLLPDIRFPGFAKNLFLLAALSAVTTALMGLLLSLEETREGNAFLWHKWTGICVAVFAAIMYWTYAVFAGKIFIGKAFSILTCLALIAAGHYGAVLTHGNNYLTAPMIVAEKVSVNDAIIFDDIIKPVFGKCTGCHNPENKKGGLDLETSAGILEGGKTGPLLKKGEPSMSLLMHRIYLPATEKKHMPPASKPQLTDEEIQVLHRWIAAGSPVKEKLTNLPVQDSFRILASQYLRGEEGTLEEPVYAFPAADPAKIKRLKSSSRVIEPLGAGSPALSVQFYGREYYSKQALSELLEIKDQVTELNLSKLPVHDEDLAIIAAFRHLNKLNLNHTSVSDKGIAALAALKSLQSLSLSGTAVTAGGVSSLARLPQMKSIFIWNTRMDSLAIAKLKSRHPEIEINTGFHNDGNAVMALPPPRFETVPGILSLPATVTLTHPVKGVTIRYSLDEMEPDSVSGAVYSGPIRLDSNKTIVARAFKNGWYGSISVRGQFLKKGFRPDSIIALTQPDYRYNNGTDILLDGDLGELRYQNGEWLAYQKLNAEYVLVFNTPVQAASVSVNMLENTGAHIFPAVSIEVWDLSNGRAESLGEINPVPPAVHRSPKIFLEKISFARREVRKLKINIRHLEHLPSWHAAKGEPAWILMSELLVN